MVEEKKYYKGCYVTEEDFLKYCKDVKRKSYYGFKGDEVKIILPNDTIVTPDEYWKSKEKKKGRWKPEEDEIYFFVDDGSIYEDEWMGNFVNEEFKYSIGNCFKTKKEAEEYKTKLIFQQQYRDYALEHNDEIDWKTSQLKHCACYNSDDNEIEITHWQSIKQQGVVHFTKTQDIWDFIKLIGEENFKKYILEIEGD